MNNEQLPMSDLDRLKQEVLSVPPIAALPCNLPDHWLEMIARDLEKIVGDGECSEDDTSSYVVASLALIIRILEGKTPSQEIKIPFVVLFLYFNELRMEVNLEISRRRTDIRTEPATLETIFTGREVLVDR